MEINLGNLGDLASLGGSLLGAQKDGKLDLNSLLGAQKDGKLDLGSLLGAQKDGKLDLNSVQQLIQNNPQVVQLMASAIGNAKTPDNQTLGNLRDALTQVVANAPAEQVDNGLKEVTGGAAGNPGGFWKLLQPYLANADKLGKLLPLLTQYAPKALEILRGFMGGASQS